MVYNQPSLDGFDGGILPLNSYSQLMSTSILDGRQTTDGRLRENLDAIPAADWLDALQVGYLITDKVGDAWEDGVYFDRQHPLALAPNEQTTIGYIPPFETDSIRLLATGLGEVELTTDDGQTWVIQPQETADGRWQLPLPTTSQLRTITFTALNDNWALSAVTLAHHDGSFIPLTLGNYRLIHSGDVKIYENLDVWPRATLHDPAATTILSPRLADGSAHVTAATPEQVTLAIDTATSAQLIFAEAAYPGWQALVDGQPAEIDTVDRLFPWGTVARWGARGGVCVPAVSCLSWYCAVPR